MIRPAPELDAFAPIRQRLLDQIAETTAMICEQHRPRIERARLHGDLDRYLAAMHRDIDRATRPLVNAWARLPMPPMVIQQ